jgi:hypothetical protein
MVVRTKVSAISACRRIAARRRRFWGADVADMHGHSQAGESNDNYRGRIDDNCDCATVVSTPHPDSQPASVGAPP